MIKKSNKKVCVGLSGGVDSSVAAALLQQSGYDVVGVYMNNWNNQSASLGERSLSSQHYRDDCPWYDDYLDAKRVALHLGIPFYLWDFREAYKRKVFDHFIDEFAKGRTPNPDIYCNSQIKFDDFQRRALDELGADYVATGHYARKVEMPAGGYTLQIPNDDHKDQTYFLYRLNQEQLATALFPLADYSKTEVRALAQQLMLPTHYKKDSQGICFIGEVDVRDFVSRWLAPRPGKIVDQAGHILGEHQGIHLYTIGENIAADNSAVVTYYPQWKQAIPHFYIAEKDMATNQLTVVPGADHPALYKKEVWLEDVCWVSGQDQSQLEVGSCFARLRHGGQLVPVETAKTLADQQLHLTFSQPQRAIAPGQHLVLYDALKRVLGGGVINRSES